MDQMMVTPRTTAIVPAAQIIMTFLCASLPWTPGLLETDVILRFLASTRSETLPTA